MQNVLTRRGGGPYSHTNVTCPISRESGAKLPLAHGILHSAVGIGTLASMASDFATALYGGLRLGRRQRQPFPGIGRPPRLVAVVDLWRPALTAASVSWCVLSVS
jgi:hypothetical protein